MIIEKPTDLRPSDTAGGMKVRVWGNFLRLPWKIKENYLDLNSRGCTVARSPESPEPVEIIPSSSLHVQDEACTFFGSRTLSLSEFLHTSPLADWIMVSSPSSTRFVGMKSGEHLIMTELSSRNQIPERGIYSASFFVPST